MTTSPRTTPPSRLRRATPPTPLRVCIVGGGAAAVLTAHRLLARASVERPVDLTVVERSRGVGPGLPYRTTHPWHLLNNMAGRLSALDDDPDHLVRWARRQGLHVTGSSFLPRSLYGHYLADLAGSLDVPDGSSLSWLRAEAYDLAAADTGHHVLVRDTSGEHPSERAVLADHVVLALGTPPPREPRLAGLEADRLDDLGDRYVADPWRVDLAERAARLGPAREVLVIGTGLTMVDVVCALHHDRPDLRFTIASRSGMLPAAHRAPFHPVRDVPTIRAHRLDDVVRSVSDSVAPAARDGRRGWRETVDALRGEANAIWAGFTPAEQDRFLRDHARSWEVLRHRMAPQTAELLRGLMRDRVVRLEHVDAVDPTAADLVVNATGPRPAGTPGWSPLVDRLLAAGTVRPHRLGLGLDLDTDGHPVDASGRADRRLTVLGAARRGTEYEVTAIPDLRTQTTRLADALLPALRHERAGRRSVAALGG